MYRLINELTSGLMLIQIDGKFGSVIKLWDVFEDRHKINELSQIIKTGEYNANRGKIDAVIQTINHMQALLDRQTEVKPKKIDKIKHWLSPNILGLRELSRIHFQR